MIARFVVSLCATVIVSVAARAETLDWNTPDGYVKAMRKLQCSLTDGKPVTFWWHGQAFGRVMGQADKNLFGVNGMNTRRCVSVKDDARGVGYRLVSRELLFYTDTKSGEILRTWDNPYTGDKVDVLPVANDPVNSGPTFGRDAHGNVMKFAGTLQGGQVWMTVTVPLFYQSPLGGDYQKNVGGFYHATEMFNFFADEKELRDGGKDQASVRVAWQRMSDWLPWMQMSGREGLIYFNTAGRMLRTWDDLPDVLKTEIAAHYPEYREPPPGNDTRPNETSWTYFKKKRPADVNSRRTDP
jgi:hypothetical protein